MLGLNMSLMARPPFMRGIAQAIQSIFKFTGTTTTSLDGSRELVNSGTGTDNVLLSTANGVDASGGVTITLPSSQYVYAVYANDLRTGKMVEQVIDGDVTSISFKHFNPVNNIVVVG